MVIRILVALATVVLFSSTRASATSTTAEIGECSASPLGCSVGPCDFN